MCFRCLTAKVGENRYDLLDKQQEFINIPHDEARDIALYQGGYGSGKTFAGSLLGVFLARKYPGSRGLVGASTFTLVEKTTLIKYFEHLENLGYKKNVHYKYNEKKHLLKFKNGSEIWFMSVDDPENFKSMDLHWVEIEEASQVSRATIDGLISRLRNTYRRPSWKNFKYRLFGHTNPEPIKGWIWDFFVDKKRPNRRLIIAPTTNNIHLPADYVDELKTQYDPEYFRINVLGEFGNYNSGLVVKGFTDENRKQLQYVKGETIHLTCDFNVDPMMWLIAHKDEENVYFFDEIVVENATTAMCMKEFIRRYPDKNANIIINGDASGDNRSTQSEFTNYAIMRKVLLENGYENFEFHLRRYNPPILNRIASFNARVRTTDGKCHLFVSDKCKWFLHNIYDLKYKEGTSLIDTPTIYQISRDRSKKFLGHIFDAGSYLTEYYWAVR